MTRIITLVAILITISVNVMAQDFSKQAELNAKKYIANLMKDPESTKFRNITVTENMKGQGVDKYLVCGEVNAKNEYGGYVGYKPFYFSGSWGEFLSDRNADIFLEIFQATCGSSM